MKRVNIEFAAGRYQRTESALRDLICNLIYLFNEEQDESLYRIGNRLIEELQKISVSPLYKLTYFDVNDEVIDRKNNMLRSRVMNEVYKYANHKNLKLHKSKFLNLLNQFLNIITGRDIDHQYFKTKVHSEIIIKAGFFKESTEPDQSKMVRHFGPHGSSWYSTKYDISYIIK